jgi:hypothetical protein
MLDDSGRLLWSDEATSMWQMSVEAAVQAVSKRMVKKL